MAKNQIPVQEGLYTWEADGPRLIGSKCSKCGEVTFPAQDICPNCYSDSMQKLTLSRKGTLYSFTIQRHKPPTPPYHGKSFEPYGIGEVELPEGVIVTAVLTESNPDALKIGMELETVVEKFYEDDEGNDVMCYKFKPVS